MWVLLLAAAFAAFAGVSAAAVMILGPSADPAASRSVTLTR